MEIDVAPPPGKMQLRSPITTIGKRPPPPTMNNFEHVRRNIRVHSAGIFRTPPYRSSPPADFPREFPDLPPRADFANISRTYLDSIHKDYPVLHWKAFQNEVDEVYTNRAFDGKSRAWIGLFFSILACGCLNHAASAGVFLHGYGDGRKFYELASQVVGPWPFNPSIVDVQLIFHLSVYAFESNLRFAGSMWLACAIKIAQQLNLHRQLDAHSAEVQVRLWWALYVLDR